MIASLTSLKKALKKRILSLQKRIHFLQEELMKDTSLLTKKLSLLSSAYPHYKKENSFVEVPDWNDQGTLVRFEIKKSLQDEIKKTAKNIKKHEKALIYFPKEIERLQSKEKLFSSYLQNLDTLSPQDLNEVEKFLQMKAAKKEQEKEPFRHFLSSNSTHIYAGKNQESNHILTFDFAKSSDIWLHAHSFSGSHVLIKTKGNPVDQKTLFEAATIAAYYSKGKDRAQVEILYTEKKHVTRKRGMKKGEALASTYSLFIVHPDKELVDTLRLRAEAFSTHPT